MKYRILAGLLLSVLSAAAEIVTLHVKTLSTIEGDTYSAEAIELEQGDVAEILSAFSEGDDSWRSISVEVGGKEVQLPFRSVGSPGSNGSGRSSPTAIRPWVIAGPAKIRAHTWSSPHIAPGQLSFLTASVTRANSTPSVAPAGTVVIPEDPSGQFSVALESSTDMITWTAANPGTYSGSEQKRFFRLRATKAK